MPVQTHTSKSSNCSMQLVPAFDGLHMSVAQAPITFKGEQYQLDDDYEYVVNPADGSREVNVYVAVDEATKAATLVVTDTAPDEPALRPIPPAGFRIVLHLLSSQVPVSAASLDAADTAVYTVEKEE